MKLYPKLLLQLIIAFMFFTAIGTIIHEFGHITTAKILGYQTKLHYGSMTYNYDKVEKKTLNRNAPKGKELDEKVKEFDDLLITIGGPLSNISVGLLGLVIIYYRRKKMSTYEMKTIDWLAVFLSLFWTREIVSLLVPIFREFMSPDGSWFSGDEFFISQNLGLWSGTISIILGILGILVFCYLVFEIIEKQKRLTFLISGLIGSSLGFMLWMNLIGPKILP